jgi:hypothetical protein
MPKASHKQKDNIAKRILEHPDREEIISKSLANIPPIEIAESLAARYNPETEKQFILSETYIKKFQSEYLDIYTTIKDDLYKTKQNQVAPSEALQQEIQGSPAYHKALEKYIDTEIDIKTMVKKMVVNVEGRISQIYDIVQEDPANFRNDRVLIEYFDTLAGILEKYDTILNGSPEQINIQNNINIQIVDDHINVIYNIIKEILSKLDYDTSLLFIEMFNNEMSKLKSVNAQILPVDKRLNEVKILEETVAKKIE